MLEEYLLKILIHKCLYTAAVIVAYNINYAILTAITLLETLICLMYDTSTYRENMSPTNVFMTVTNHIYVQIMQYTF